MAFKYAILPWCSLSPKFRHRLDGQEGEVRVYQVGRGIDGGFMSSIRSIQCISEGQSGRGCLVGGREHLSERRVKLTHVFLYRI